jgi:hypothetical protein
VELRARVKGEVFIRLRVLDPAYTAGKFAHPLNDGHASWDVGGSARYRRIEKNRKVIAEIEYAGEDNGWERHQADRAEVQSAFRPRGALIRAGASPEPFVSP